MIIVFKDNFSYDREGYHYIYLSHKILKSGGYFKAVKKINHPLWDKYQGIKGSYRKYDYDIRLIKLGESVDISPKDKDYYRENIICLPAKDFEYRRSKLVMAAGWGLDFTRLQIGPMNAKVFKSQYSNIPRMQVEKILGRSKICKVIITII